MLENKKYAVSTAVTAALICIATLSGIFMQLSDDTYLHIGDAAIYIAAMLMPFNVAVIAAPVGCAVADMFLGSWVYVIPTLIIKTATVIAAFRLRKCCKSQENGDLLVCFSGVVTVVGYYFAEVIINIIRKMSIAEAFSAAAPGIMFNILQMLAAAVVFMAFANMSRKIYAKYTAPRVKKPRRRRKKKSELTEDDE